MIPAVFIGGFLLGAIAAGLCLFFYLINIRID